MKRVTSSTNLTGLHKDIRALAEEALLLGWPITATRKGYRISPPGAVRALYLPRGNQGSNVVFSLSRAFTSAKRHAGVEPPPPDDVPEEQPSITSEGPLLVPLKRGKAGAGFFYRSQTTIERHWSDGAVDYKCVLCDMTAAVASTIARHYGKSNSHPHLAGRERVIVNDDNVPVHMGGEPRHDEPEPLPSTTTEPQVQAGQSEGEGPFSTAAGTFSTEEILLEIQNLVGLRALRAQVHYLQVENATLTRRLEESEARSQSLRESLTTVGTILEELRNDG